MVKTWRLDFDSPLPEIPIRFGSYWFVERSTGPQLNPWQVIRRPQNRVDKVHVSAINSLPTTGTTLTFSGLSLNTSSFGPPSQVAAGCQRSADANYLSGTDDLRHERLEIHLDVSKSFFLDLIPCTFATAGCCSPRSSLRATRRRPSSKTTRRPSFENWTWSRTSSPSTFKRCSACLLPGLLSIQIEFDQSVQCFPFVNASYPFELP